VRLPGLAMRHRSIVLAATIIAATWGLAALFTAPRRDDPEITIRRCVITTSWPGATAQKVEQLITDPIEKAVDALDEVDRLTSVTTTGHSAIYVIVDDDVTDVDNVWDKVRAKVDTIRPDLPRGSTAPLVNSDFGDTAAMVLALYQLPCAKEGRPGDKYTPRELEIYAEKVKDELNLLDEVAKVELQGQQREAIYLEVDPGAWSRTEMTIGDLRKVLEQRNIVAPGGTIDTAGARFGVKPSGELSALAEIERIIVGTHANRTPVYLKDLGITVSRRYEEPPGTIARFGSGDLPDSVEAVMISFTMKTGRNITALGEKVRGLIARAGATMLPADIRLGVVVDSPRSVNRAISHFTDNLWYAIVIVILVAFFLIGLRIAIIMSAAIPMVILASFGICRFFGVQLEQVAISSLIIALGMLVDNAIEVGDNVHRFLEAGHDRYTAAVEGSRQIAFPVLIATLTTVAAFLPMLTLGGDVGEYIFSLPIVVSTTLIVSWLLAMTMTTIMAYWLFRPRKDHGRMLSPLALLLRGVGKLASQLRRKKVARGGGGGGGGGESWGIRLYVSVCRWCLGHKLITIGLAGAAFVAACSLVATGRIGSQYFPQGYRDQFVIDVWLPEGTPIARTSEVCREVEDILRRKSPGLVDGRRVQRLRTFASYVGQGAPRFYLALSPEPRASNYAQIVVNTHSPQTTADYLADVRDAARARIAGARIVARKLDMGPPVDSPIAIRLLGDDIPTLRAYGRKLAAVLRSADGASDVHDSWGLDGYQLDVDIDEDKASLAGVSNAAVAQTTNALFSGLHLTTYREGDHEVPIYFRLPSDQRHKLQAVGAVHPEGKHGKVPLDAIANVKPTRVPAKILRHKMNRNLEIRARVQDGWLPNAVLDSVMGRIDQIRRSLPHGYRIEIGGEQEEITKSRKGTAKAFGISILLIVFCLVVQYNSFVKPLIILLTLPMAAIGALFGLFITGRPMGFMANLGLLSLAGVVLNDTIVLIEFVTDLVRRKLREGDGLAGEGERSCSGLKREVFRECVTRGARMRILPIVLTTLTTVGGMLPLALAGGPLWEPMAIVIIFGLLMATMLTLIVLPSILTVFVEHFGVRLAEPPAEPGR